MTTCPCGHPSKAAFICKPCTAQLGRDLDTIASLWPESAVTLTRTDKVGAGSAGASASPSHPLPVNMRASEVRDEVANTIGTWVRIMAGDSTPNDVRTIPQACAWLKKDLPTIILRPESTDMLDQIWRLADKITRLIDRPEAPTYLGTHACGADIWAKSHQTDEKCRGCPAVLDLEAIRSSAAERAWVQWATSRTICDSARMLGVPIHKMMISRWYRSGRLDGAHRLSDDGKTLEFLVGAVVNLARQHAKIEEASIA